jgi:hypothetical protein
MITHELLMMAIEDKWPQLLHGRDYLAGHPIDPATGEQCGDAFIFRWACADIAEPELAPLLDAAELHRPVLAARQARATRNTLLSGSDWTQLGDARAAIKTSADAWAKYRQALRDVPQQPGFPLDIEWPVVPGSGL